MEAREGWVGGRVPPGGPPGIGAMAAAAAWAGVRVTVVGGWVGRWMEEDTERDRGREG